MTDPKIPHLYVTDDEGKKLDITQGYATVDGVIVDNHSDLYDQYFRMLSVKQDRAKVEFLNQ